MLIEVSKTIQVERLQSWYYWLEWFMRYTVDMTSGGMIYIPSFMKLVEAFKQY
jgi:hypothetical protein